MLRRFGAGACPAGGREPSVQPGGGTSRPRLDVRPWRSNDLRTSIAVMAARLRRPRAPRLPRLVALAVTALLATAVPAALPVAGSAAVAPTTSAGGFAVYASADTQAVTVPPVTNRLLVFVFAGKFGGDTPTSTA
jgi:hypothetical protein